jgi:hypothetical protein
MGHPLLRYTDQNPSDVLLLSVGEVLPQLMRRNPVVALGRWRRSGGLDWHRC